jgi:hypothetical protein
MLRSEDPDGRVAEIIIANPSMDVEDYNLTFSVV